MNNVSLLPKGKVFQREYASFVNKDTGKRVKGGVTHVTLDLAAILKGETVKEVKVNPTVYVEINEDGSVGKTYTFNRVYEADQA